MESSTASAFDELGFPICESADEGKRESYARWFQPKADRRLTRFEARRRTLPRPGDWLSVPKDDLKSLLRKGVPDCHRHEVWWSVLRCEERRAQSYNSFAELVQADLDASVAGTIDRDLGRTFPGHRRFETEAGQVSLRNVLHAFACHLPQVGYCQGLNFIAALLLVVFVDEERAFWAFASAIKTLGVQDYYAEGMVLLRADVEVLTKVLAQKAPKTSNRMREQGVELMSIVSEWFLTWFAKSLPVRTVLRVWDTLFFEGFKVFFRVAVGIFKRAEAEILQCATFDTLMLNSKEWSRKQVEHNELLKASFHDLNVHFYDFAFTPLRRRDLSRARDVSLTRVAREDAERHRRREASREPNNRAGRTAPASPP